MKSSNIQKVSLLILGCVFSVSLISIDSYAQNYWERRQKSQDQLRKKQLGTTEDIKEEQIPAEKEAPAPLPPADSGSQPEPTYNDEDFDLGLGLGSDNEEYTDDFDFEASTETFTMPVDLDIGLDLGGKEIKKIADKTTLIDPNKIKVDERYGTIKEVHTCKKPGAPLIIHVQDAHVNYDAQVSIAHIIEELLANYGINQIHIEGGSLENNAPDYVSIYNRFTRVERAKILLKEGNFTGVNYLYASTSYPLEIKGIEDIQVYTANVDLYFEIEKLRPNARKYLDSLKVNINNLKASVFSKELNEMAVNKDSYAAETITLNSYVKFLGDKAKVSGIEIKEKYSNVAGLLETIALEEEISFPEVDTEREKLISSLKTKLSQTAYKKLEDKQSDFILGKLKAKEFYSYLASLEKSGLAKNYGNLAKYSVYLDVFSKIDTYDLFKEIEQLESQIKTSLYKNEDERSLDKIAYDFGILREFLELGLTPDEYKYYSNNRSDINIDNWISAVSALQKKYKMNKAVPRNSADAQKIIPKLENFYKSAILRDKVMLEKSLNHIQKSNSNAAIMVCGGFHTPRITGMMRTLGVSYVVIAPKINNPTQPGLYDKIMRQNR